MNEAEILEYALEGMAPGLRKVAAAHLKECDGCREQVASVMHLHVPLARLARGVKPPPGLRARVLRGLKSRPK
jgi:hypothetical protein